jgi:hypothetical protein
MACVSYMYFATIVAVDRIDDIGLHVFGLGILVMKEGAK